MALIKCPECGGQISSFAKVCPHCGRPMNIAETSPLNHPKESEQAKEETLSEAEQMRRERERLFAEERLRNRTIITQQEESGHTQYMPKSTYNPTYKKPIIPRQTYSEDSEDVKDQASQGRERSLFILLWLLGILGYFGYLAIDASISLIQHIELFKQMDTEFKIYTIADVLIPLEFFIGAIQLLFWKKSGFGRIVFGSLLYSGLIIYIMVKYNISSPPSFIVRDIITAIAAPIVTYLILQIQENGKSCWEWMD